MEDIFGNHKAERLAQGCSCNPPRSGLPSLCPCLRSLRAVGLVAAPRKGSTLTSHPADSAAWARAWIVGWELVRQPWPCAHPSAQWCRYVCWAVLFVSWITYAIDRSGKPHSSLHTCPLNVVFVCFFFSGRQQIFRKWECNQAQVTMTSLKFCRRDVAIGSSRLRLRVLGQFLPLLHSTGQPHRTQQLSS